MDNNFIDVAENKIGKRKMQRIEDVIRSLLKDSVDVRLTKDRFIDIEDKKIVGNINDTSYAQAFGVMQGISYALGYKSCAVTNDETKPGYWFETIANQVWKEQYNKEYGS